MSGAGFRSRVDLIDQAAGGGTGVSPVRTERRYHVPAATQNILLSSAAQRETSSVYLLPTTVIAGPGPIDRTLDLVAKRGLVEEREVSTPEQVCGKP